MGVFRLSLVLSFVLIYLVPNGQVSAQQINDHSSSNNICTCLYGPDGTDQRKRGICASPPIDCTELMLCDQKFACVQPKTICVKIVQCHSQQMCYPLAMATPAVCPLRTTPSDGICKNAIWSTSGKTVAGNHGPGAALEQLSNPFGLFVDPNDDDALIIVDSGNKRVMKWKKGATSGQVIAGGNGLGNRTDQLASPRYVTVDREGTLFITEYTNKRVSRWKKGALNGEIIISNMDVNGIALDHAEEEHQHLFVGDWSQARILRFNKNGTGESKVVIGDKGPGTSLEQLDTPYQMYIDRQGSIFVPEYSNSRVTKWSANSGIWETTAILAAGGNGNGDKLNQLDGTLAVVVDQSGTVYAADYGNHRIVRWLKEAASGTIIAGGNGQGNSNTQLNHPYDLAFDRDGNLYVSDFANHRIQMFAIDKSACASGK